MQHFKWDKCLKYISHRFDIKSVSLNVWIQMAKKHSVHHNDALITVQMLKVAVIVMMNKSAATMMLDVRTLRDKIFNLNWMVMAEEVHNIKL